MSDITKPVVLTNTLSTLVAEKKNDANFSYKNWGDDDLLDFRSFVRNYYRTAQRARCAYCREKLSLQSAANCHVEHIAPKSKYQSFMFEPRNLCVVCADCNAIKREQEVCNDEPDTVARGPNIKNYPRSSNAFRIVHPHFDVYGDHILVTSGFYVDRTEKGHFTIGACRLNRRVQEFGWDETFIEDESIFDAARSLLEATDRKTRLSALQRIREACQA
ncbi:HNHc domain-containing protein [Paraburkholderia sabiae]|uniref:HNH endonuclease n=1 Tax=Paraburkholderia sabiae TaxID=273251 RepID=UPI001CADB4EB|nr:HNH endonuclease domain-containing protein [Paraburkholderia sabiae]CAG9225640.1 HNHc domain-containing protein [Paraburkholderia sabiae]